MKINIGLSITIAISVFICFIMYLVINSYNLHFDLYSTNYYEQEINYQDKIDAKWNMEQLKESINISIENNNIIIVFPISLVKQKIGGSICFYKPDNSDLDKEFDIDLNGNIQNININDLSEGLYKININLYTADKRYNYEKDFKLEKE